MKKQPRGLSYLANATFIAAAFALAIVGVHDAEARDIEYHENEVAVYVTPGEPTQITFPDKIEGGFKRKHSSLALERQGNFLVVFAQPEIPYEGEALLVHTKTKRSFALRIMPSDDENPRDEFIKLRDMRDPNDGEDGLGLGGTLEPGVAPPTVPPGLMRYLVMVAEFGKRGGIPGYRRSNRFTGETVLHDGTIEAKVEEVFMGTSLWGYVLTVENLLDTSYRLNPATFQLDGTRMVGAERWELAARPITAEQKLAKGHIAKVYIVTRSNRR